MVDPVVNPTLEEYIRTILNTVVMIQNDLLNMKLILSDILRRIT